ncbi:MAG: hypothetical protein P4L16_03985 [Chlamydiales bacterium]|nr:hypothetical protein [Chlamydiales bacterium]
MNKSDKISIPLEQNHFLEEFLSKWGKTILYTSVGLGSLLFLLYRFFLSTPEQSISSFLDAKATMAKLKANSQEITSFDHLKSLLNDSSRLQVYYDATLANELIYKDDWLQAKPYAEAALKRSISTDNAYKLYSETSLLIGIKNYQEALNSTLSLSEDLKDKPSYALLYGCNLLRLASLYHELQLPQEETNTWKMWQKFADDEKNNSAFQKIQMVFQKGSCCLENYVTQQLK